jgi:hypothetical protein
MTLCTPKYTQNVLPRTEKVCSNNKKTDRQTDRQFGRIPWTADRPIARPLPTHDSATKTTDAEKHPRPGSEPTICVRAMQSVRTLDHEDLL